jgi:hypothetical protein
MRDRLVTVKAGSSTESIDVREAGAGDEYYANTSANLVGRPFRAGLCRRVPRAKALGCSLKPLRGSNSDPDPTLNPKKPY